ncbi:hypothetical protein LSCM1_01489 [Leishmania martiniquensis]|uniref:Uncharacterized protein n=1 Tax=Leishmania martiniquensis TaxID=1580590 RepID=A0A836GDD1_9TRYP|nr:hypothetical protein LSCM1_01489 [Leishmania martiniquensis]
MGFRLIFLICVIVCSVGLLSLVVLFALSMCQPSCFQPGSPWGEDAVPVIPATVLVNRVSDDDPHTPAGESAGPRTNRPMAADGERQQEELGMRERPSMEAPQNSGGNPYAAHTPAPHPPPTSEAEHSAQHDGGDPLPEAHDTRSYDRWQHRGSSPRSHRSSSTRTTGSERSFRAHAASHSEHGHSPYDRTPGSFDVGATSTPRQVGGAGTLRSSHHSRERGDLDPMAHGVRPLALINANPLAPMGLMRYSIQSAVPLASAASLQYADRGRLSFASLVPRGPAEDALGSRRRQPWRWRRRHSVARDPCSPHSQDTHAVVDGYCCDTYGNRVRIEDADNVYGRAQYISRESETVFSVETPSKEDSEADGVGCKSRQ